MTATGEGRYIEVGLTLARAHSHPLIAFGTMWNTITTWLYWRALGTTGLQTMWSMWKDDREQDKDVNPFPKKILTSPIGYSCVQFGSRQDKILILEIKTKFSHGKSYLSWADKKLSIIWYQCILLRRECYLPLLVLHSSSVVHSHGTPGSSPCLYPFSRGWSNYW